MQEKTPDLYRSRPGRPCDYPRRYYRRVRGFGSGIPLPRSRYACPPGQPDNRFNEVLRGGAEEGAPHDEREPAELLRQDPAALQRRSAQAGAATGIPVIPFFLKLHSQPLVSRKKPDTFHFSAIFAGNSAPFHRQFSPPMT